MNKRSAMIVAAGLIVALAAGAYALSLGSTGPTAAAAAKTAHRHKPIVKTIRRTVTVHQKAPASTHAVVATGPAPSVAPISGSSYQGSYGEPEDTSGASDDGAFSGGGSSSALDD
jgi:hypothetical protein